MRYKILWLFLSLSTSLPIIADENTWSFEYKTFTGQYAIYGGDLGDSSPPSAANSNISIKIEKKAAKAIFEDLGGDVKNQCASEAGERMRMKKDLICYKTTKDEYSCYIGFDLKTGKSKVGIIC